MMTRGALQQKWTVSRCERQAQAGAVRWSGRALADPFCTFCPAFAATLTTLPAMGDTQPEAAAVPLLKL